MTAEHPSFCRGATPFVALAAVLFVGSPPAAADLPPDEGFAARSDAVVAAGAARWEPMASYDNCVRFGFATIYLAAAIEAHDRGLSGGIAPADAEDHVRLLADEAIRLMGTGSTRGRCAWESSGSPAGLHGALGLGTILHRWGDELSETVRNRVGQALVANWRSDIGPYLVNGNLSIVAGRLLGGEALGYDSAAWEAGLRDLEEIFVHTRATGTLEVNAPSYTHYHFAALAPMTTLNHARASAMARILLDLELLAQAHQYLPGGGIGAPQARDYGGGARDDTSSGLHRALGYLTGETAFDAEGNPHVTSMAVSGYALPEAIRAIFLDKGEGYTFGLRTDAPVTSRTGAGYPFGPSGQMVAPWQIVAVPDAMLGVNFGFRYQSIHVSMGVYARAPDGTFPILYHYQPYVEGDTTLTGGGLPSTGGDTDPDDFRRELYDYERLVHGRTMISLWNPTLEGKPDGTVRTHRDTRALIPDYAAVGGEMRVEDGWYVGRVGAAYIAYRPLGTIEAEERRDGDYYIRLAGKSGCIVELATTAQFASIEDYLADLQARTVSFSQSPLRASFEALDPSTGERVPVELVHAPEQRFVGGVELTAAEALDRGLVDGPWTGWNAATQVLRVERDCYDRVVYDWAAPAVSTEAAPATCGAPGDETVFSPVPYLGDLVNWEPAVPMRWSVAQVDGDARLRLASYERTAADDRLGALALVRDRAWEDFTLRLTARTAVDPAAIANADYAIVFGWQSPDEYYFLLANSTAEYNELYALEGGVRRLVARASATLVPDAAWHDVEVTRSGSDIVVRFDGEEVLRATDDTYGLGRIGVGSLNDSALFDDVEVWSPGEGGPPDGGDDAGARAGADAGATGDVDASGPATGGCACDVPGGRSTSGGVPLLLCLALLVGRSLRRR